MLTSVIVGGGPTGVEMAGAIAEIAHRTLSDEFPSIRAAESASCSPKRGEHPSLGVSESEGEAPSGAAIRGVAIGHQAGGEELLYTGAEMSMVGLASWAQADIAMFVDIYQRWNAVP